MEMDFDDNLSRLSIMFGSSIEGKYLPFKKRKTARLPVEEDNATISGCIASIEDKHLPFKKRKMARLTAEEASSFSCKQEEEERQRIISYRRTKKNIGDNKHQSAKNCSDSSRKTEMGKTRCELYLIKQVTRSDTASNQN